MLTAIHKTLSRSSRLIPFAAAVILPFACAFAQTSLPDEMVRKNEISPADREQMKALVDANKAGLTGGPVDIKKARDVLVAPLEKEGVSVPFRIAYADALLVSGSLATLAADPKNDLVAANALRIAGQAATGNTLKLVLDGLKDTRPQVRYAATVAARTAFAAARSNPALTPDELSRAMRVLSDTVSTDAAAQPIDGALQAMVAARDISGNRSIAIERLTDAAEKRALKLAKASEPVDLAPLLRLALPLQTDILEPDKLTTEAKKGILTFAAQLLIAVNAQWKDGDPDPATVLTARTANALLSLAAENILGPGQKFTGTFGELAAPGKKEQFQRELDKLIATLKAPPFEIKPEKLTP